ncbi:MAG: hypothetical protein ABSH08_07285 [Tepidisphaeraceae bacterium]|jgi:hypothetical protein
MAILNYESSDNLPRAPWWKIYLVGIPVVAILYVAVVLFYIDIYLKMFHHHSAVFEATFSYPFLSLVNDGGKLPRLLRGFVGGAELAWIAVALDGMFCGLVIMGGWHVARSIDRRVKRR